MLWRSILLASAAIGAAGAAQSAPPQQEVVVNGRLPDQAAARRFVGSITSEVDGQLSRLSGPICPDVIGVSDEAQQRGIRRIREIASQAGIATAPAKCAVNVSVIFTNDPDALIAGMRSKLGGLFASTPSADVDALVHSRDPARVWFLTQVQNEDGAAAYTNGAPVKGNPNTTATVNVRSASIIHRSVQQATLQAFVVIDSRATTGMNMTQLIDYAAMRALGRTRAPRDGAGSGTILSLFDAGQAAPERITYLDMAFLRALYRVGPTMSVGAQRDSIASKLSAGGKGVD